MTQTSTQNPGESVQVVKKEEKSMNGEKKPNKMLPVKTTALVSVIGLEDMVFSAKIAGDTLRQPFTFYMLVGFLFLLITAVSDLAMRYFERRYRFEHS